MPVPSLWTGSARLRTPEEQAAYSRAACGEDEDLRLRVQRLLNGCRALDAPQTPGFRKIDYDRSPK
jgi:hypothetical protein